MIADFRDLLAGFAASGVRFLVVGAHALAAFGAPLGTLSLRESDFVKPDQVVQLGLPPYRIDLMTSISGVGFAEAWAERFTGTLFDVPVGFIGREAFIRNKRASGRPKDLEDIRSLGD